MFKRLGNEGEYAEHQTFVCVGFQNLGEEWAEPFGVQFSFDLETEGRTEAEDQAIVSWEALDQSLFIDTLSLIGKLVEPAPYLIILQV